jgi:hypothetical protein
MSSGGYQSSSINYAFSSIMPQKNNKSLDPQPLTSQQSQLPAIPEEKKGQSSIYNTYNTIKKLIFKQ